MDMFLARNKDGITIHIREAENGYGCGCTCLRCGKPVNARQGGTNTWSFAHIPNEIDGNKCSNTNGESDLHKYAKRLFEEHSSIYLPAIHYGDGLPDRTFYHSSSKLGQVVPEGKGKDFMVKEAKVEETLHLPSGGIIRPDVLLTIGEKQVAVEIVVTHDIDEEKRAGYVSLKMSVLRIDLQGLILEELPKEELDKLILGKSSRKTWSFNQYAFEENQKREARERAERDAAETIARAKQEEAKAIVRSGKEADDAAGKEENDQALKVKEIDQKMMDRADYLQSDEFRYNPYRDWYLDWVPKCIHHPTQQRMMLWYSHKNNQFFWSCREYPQCKHTESLSSKRISCPRCHIGYIEPVYIEPLRRNGFRCTNYKECTFLFVDPASPRR